MSESLDGYNRRILFRAQELGCDQAEATLWALIASRRRITEDASDTLDAEIGDYVKGRSRGNQTLDNLALLLAEEGRD